MRRAIVIGLLAACHRDPPPPSASSPSPRVETASASASRPASPQPPQPRPAPSFVANRGRDVLVANHVRVEGMVPGAWEGHWVGTQHMLEGALTGQLPVDMTITRRADGTLQLEQSAFGVAVIDQLIASPTTPQLAAGTDYKLQAAGEVTATFRSELTAVVSGDHLAIGRRVETDDPGRYHGQTIPKPPPATSLTLLDRR